MPSRLTKTDDYNDIIREIIETDPDHYHLHNARVTIAVLLHTGDSDLMLHGYPCAATIKITSTKDRELGMTDAVMTLRLDAIAEMKREELAALIDHELYHLSPVVDEWEYQTNPDGSIYREANGDEVKLRCSYKWDTADRPKIKMRKHDIQVGWFSRMIEKHGRRSAEATQVKALVTHYGQLLFGFAATEIELAGTRARFEKRKMVVPAEFHHELDSQLAKRDRAMIRSQRTGANPDLIPNEEEV